ncbi:RGCVC family protein [Nocardia sp. XZ_19_385]|uniref:RGCVC family protein n=1 Tax=Nocardia sp. XZ_19_385 TaxID=2769488 RepID=UPI00188FF70F|nr:RGCVC family protein [Nocardia sp. XZ_19_385]
MSATDTQTKPAEDQSATNDGGCPACKHPRDAHDQISQRFCDATAAGHLDRGCVCPRAN